YNLLAVYAICNLLGAGKTEILTTLSNLNPVPGRFEVIISDREVMAIVDYAHTPDALRNVLKAINQIRNGNQQLITVVGAGGDRDKAKRPLMAGVAAEGSNKLILTSDNPRNENPGDIVEDMLGGITKEQKKKVISILDRREAIRTACFIAGKGDIILIAGKGHETYQEVKNVRHHFDDREVIREFFKAENNRS
ncbi:MAG: UDP-N-acetylmuramoyl-L-alanyl-D-glutamate--2,6-diaminopimelate ligase, partial [Bacteroidales bacterium]